MSRLSELVSILTGPHLSGGYSPDGGMVVGTEEGLLLQLEEAVAGSVTPGSAGGSDPRTRTPLDLNALALYEHIGKTVNRNIRPIERHYSLVSRIFCWEGHAGKDNEELERTLEIWVDQIRECLNPTPRRPLPGITCPECLVGVLPRILDGETVLVPVITVYPKSLVAECEHCEATWQGREGLMQLALRQERDSG